MCRVSVLLQKEYTANENMCNFTFLLLTKPIPFVFQLNPAVMYPASDNNSLPSALLQAIPAYYQAKLWNGPPSAAGQTFPGWDLRLKKKCFITADQSAIQRCLEVGTITRKNQNYPTQRKKHFRRLSIRGKKHLYLLTTIYSFGEPAYEYCYLNMQCDQQFFPLIHDYQKPCFFIFIL